MAAFKDQHYLPEAVANFVAFLGWAPSGSNDEVFDMDELIERFDLNKVQKAGAIVNIEKLDWFNAQHLRKLATREPARLLEIIRPILETENFDLDSHDSAVLYALLELASERVSKPFDFAEECKFFFVAPESPAQKNSDAWFRNLVDDFEQILNAEDPAKPSAALNTAISKVPREIPKRAIFQALRVALTGNKQGPSLASTVDLLGRTASLERLRTVL
eukprot:TRINITY_DN10632_c0_g1_i1.p1 TRINITY_DN10632_c0_g1~~TRINITY_DN10632_c0_g1_i1.p1  ORF type:complete len:254 (-),score=50.39 TRINITY_DN10632_c0_g1_i1:3-656(-)